MYLYFYSRKFKFKRKLKGTSQPLSEIDIWENVESEQQIQIRGEDVMLTPDRWIEIGSMLYPRALC